MNFDGGDLSSDGGLMLLRRVEERIELTRAVAAVFSDPRNPARITHRLRDLLAQLLCGVCCGCEDLNDHDSLRADLLMQTAVDRAEPLASSPTLCRLENRASRAQAVALHEVLTEQLIGSNPRAPTELVLDIDAPEVPLHGRHPCAAAEDRCRHRTQYARRERLLSASHHPLRAFFSHAAHALAP